MVTLNTADKALKDYYLDVIADQLNTGANPFLAMVEKTTEDVYGKEIKKVVSYGINGGIASGSENGSLPPTQGNLYAEFTLPLKNLYGQIEITDKALRASEEGSKTAVNLLNAEMNGLVKASKMNFSRMLFGDGSGYFGKVTDGDNAKRTLTLDNVSGIEEGTLIDFYRDTAIETKFVATKVVAIDRATKKITVNVAVDTIANGTKVFAHGSRDGELTGLGAIFSDTATSIYGLDKASNSWLKPSVKTIASISFDDVQEMLDLVEERGGESANVIICSWKVRRILQKLFAKAGVTPSYVTVDGGYNAMAFNGIPVVVDKFCPEGYMYFLNSKDFKICQLCDWQWLTDGDGRILRQISGKAAYSATLVKYADLLCEKPCGQGLIKGITGALEEAVLVETVTAE